MLLPVVLVLAQVATATPRPTPGAAPTKTPAPNPLASTVRPDTTPRTLGASHPQPSSIGSLGSRVKLNKEKAGTIFRQDVIPTPAPAAAVTPGAKKKATDEAYEKSVAADIAAEKEWRRREQDRRERLAAARQNQSDICARYAAAAANAGIQAGRTSDAAGAILGALQADCNTATRRADAVEAERETLAEECRKTQGCHPGWLR